MEFDSDNIVGQTAALATDLAKPELVTLPGGAQVLVAPKDKQIHEVKKWVDAWRVRPERRKGTATLLDLDSFIAWVKRFRDEGTKIFATSRQEPALLAVIDYHWEGKAAEVEPRFGEHRGRYAFPLSKQWKTWTGAARKAFTQNEFAEFIEDNIRDILPPPDPKDEADRELRDTLAQMGARAAGPERMISLAAGLDANADVKATVKRNRDTGETKIAFETQLRDGSGAQLDIPNAMIIGIPVFEGDALYRLAVRLRVRFDANNGTIHWLVQVQRPDLYLDHAFNEAVAKVEKETGIGVLFGQPEA